MKVSFLILLYPWFRKKHLFIWNAKSILILIALIYICAKTLVGLQNSYFYLDCNNLHHTSVQKHLFDLQNSYFYLDCINLHSTWRICLKTVVRLQNFYFDLVCINIPHENTCSLANVLFMILIYFQIVHLCAIYLCYNGITLLGKKCPRLKL